LGCKGRVHLGYLRNSNSIIIIMGMDMGKGTDKGMGISLGRKSINREKKVAVSRHRGYLV
jgi:hypothetical protein